MSIRELFVSDVTRDIPPVVYFLEQNAEKVAAKDRALQKKLQSR